MRSLASPKAAQQWSMTSLRDKLIKIGAKGGRHGRYVTFQMAEVAVPNADVPGNLSVTSVRRAGTAWTGRWVKRRQTARRGAALMEAKQ